MIQLYKASIWQNAVGKWEVNCVDDLAGVSGKWWIPCCVLSISPVDYVLLLKDKFNVKHFVYNLKSDVLIFSWDNYMDAFRYQNYINNEAKKRNFLI